MGLWDVIVALSVARPLFSSCSLPCISASIVCRYLPILPMVLCVPTVSYNGLIQPDIWCASTPMVVGRQRDNHPSRANLLSLHQPRARENSVTHLFSLKLVA